MASIQDFSSIHQPCKVGKTGLQFIVGASNTNHVIILVDYSGSLLFPFHIILTNQCITRSVGLVGGGAVALIFILNLFLSQFAGAVAVGGTMHCKLAMILKVIGEQE